MTRRRKPKPDKYAKDAHTWSLWADLTYAGASKLFDPHQPGLWFSAAVLGQQALEMLLKAALIRKGHTVVQGDVWGHDLPKLARLFASETPGLPPIVDSVRVFSDLFKELRYPQGLKRVSGVGEEERELLDAIVQVLRPYARGEK